MLMLALGFVTRYGGTDATLGLAFTTTGVLYPFFAALLGWLGVALTGSDTSSNVLFGSLQKITAQQLGFNPVLIVTANSTGGVMGKMIDAQSIVVATASTGQAGQEGRILRFVFWHSLALVGDHGRDRDAAGVRVQVDGTCNKLSAGYLASTRFIRSCLMIEQHYLDDARRQLRKLKAQADQALAQTTDEHFFAMLDPESNSIALIMKHMAGNMRSRWTDFLTSDGEKPDRDRDRGVRGTCGG